MGRRTFITGLSAPLILGATNKSGSSKPILGEGDHKYEVTHDWGELPANIKYGNTHGVCEDSQGHIYVHHTVNAASESNDSMVVFDGKGKFVKSWGKEFKGGAHGLHIHKEGKQEFLYLCDTKRARGGQDHARAAKKCSRSAIRRSPNSTSPAPTASRSSTARPIWPSPPNGDIYVGDGYGSSYINQYNSKGEYIRTFGGPGKDAGQLICPHGMICRLRAASGRI